MTNTDSACKKKKSLATPYLVQRIIVATRSHQNSNTDVCTAFEIKKDGKRQQKKSKGPPLLVGTHVGTISIGDANEVLTALIVAVSSVSLPSVYPIGSSSSKALTLSESLERRRREG